MVDVLLGLQWGDEGKGKIVDYFAPNYDVVARFQGGPNAGHTLYVQDKKVVLHQIPSGIFHQHCINLIGNGVVLDLITLQKECNTVSSFGIDVKKNLFLSNKTHLILPTHRALDKASEIAKGNDKIGSTLKGIGPTYMDKTGRNGLRFGDLIHNDFKTEYEKLRTKHLRMLDSMGASDDISADEILFFESVEFARSFQTVNSEYFINEKIKTGNKILAEGAQGSMLDIDFGTYPFVTSSNTLTAGACTGLGISPQTINKVIGVTKAYCTRVGSGPFPTELHNETGEALRTAGSEFGATTGRPRRCGWIDLVALNYACMLNGVTDVVMTKTDVLDSFKPLQVCTAYNVDGVETKEIPFNINQANIVPVYQSFDGWENPMANEKKYEDLGVNVKNYINFINNYLGVNVTLISNGPGRDQIIVPN
jgi:adenylosuccinate synthase